MTRSLETECGKRAPIINGIF
jgi:hypothetical protein